MFCFKSSNEEIDILLVQSTEVIVGGEVSLSTDEESIPLVFILDINEYIVYVCIFICMYVCSVCMYVVV